LIGSGFRGAAARRSTHIALAPVGLGQRRKWQPLGASFSGALVARRRPGGGIECGINDV